MKLRYKILIVLLYIAAIGVRSADPLTYYDGVYSGCILLLGKPNMTEFEMFTVNRYCIETKEFASSQELMEKFYKSKEQDEQLESIIENGVEF